VASWNIQAEKAPRRARIMPIRIAAVIILLVTTAAVAQTQTGQTQPQSQIPGAAAYQPKFPGDPAHSDAEAAALGYMRTLVNAQKLYYKRHQAYATSLRELVGQGSFTRRMASTDRGDYTVHFRSTGKTYSVSLVPRQFDPAHRAFYVDETGLFHAEDDKPATKQSPELI
jgi:hypothetical protein